jgi:hypothetical protein
MIKNICCTNAKYFMASPSVDGLPKEEKIRPWNQGGVRLFYSHPAGNMLKTIDFIDYSELHGSKTDRSIPPVQRNVKNASFLKGFVKFLWDDCGSDK